MNSKTGKKNRLRGHSLSLILYTLLYYSCGIVGSNTAYFVVGVDLLACDF